MSQKPQVLDYDSVFPVGGKPGKGLDSFNRDYSSRTEVDLEASAADSSKPNTVKTSDTDGQATDRRQARICKRGHSITFPALFVFSVVLYFRPYELVPALSSLTTMAFYVGVVTLAIFVFSQLTLEGNLTARPREVNLALLLGLAALLSMPLAINRAEAWQTFAEVLVKALIIFIVLVNVVRTEKRLELLLLLVIVVSIYLSVNALGDYRAGVFKIGKASTFDARIAGSIKGLFENSNDLALHLVSIAPISFALGMVKRGLVRKLLYFGAAGLMISAVIVTFSRGGFLGLIAASLVLVHKMGRKNRVGSIAVLVFGLILFVALAPGSYSGRLATIFDSGSDLTGSSSQRTQVLKRSILVALRYPLTGVGIGNFHHRSYQELGTHNAYTQVASEMGIPALIVYVLFMIYPLKRLRQIERETHGHDEDRRLYYLAIGLQAALIGYMVSSFFGAVAYQWYVYYLVSYAVCLHRLFLIRPNAPQDASMATWEHPFSKKVRSGPIANSQMQLSP